MTVGELLCPECLKKGLKVQMLYDPQRHEYYCPVCGYTVENRDEVFIPFSNDESNKLAGFSSSFYSIADKNMGSKLTPRDLQEIIVSVKNGYRGMTRHEIDYLLSNEENRTFQENLDTLKLVISNLKRMGYNINIQEVEEITKLVGKVFGRSKPTKNKRFYRSLYVFLAVLYHHLIYKYLSKQKSEILEDIVEASIDVASSNEPKHIRKQIERKYDAIKNMLPRPRVSLADKITAVADRFGVDRQLALDIASKYLDRKILNSHSSDSIAFGVVYYVLDEIERRKIPEKDRKLFSGGARTVYNIIREKKLKEIREKGFAY